MLAAWFRLKYPHVANGALASSAPILNRVTSPDEYSIWTTKVYRDTSESCYKTIKNSWAEFDRVASKTNGLSILSKKFKLCSPLDDVEDLKDTLVSTYKQSAQYDSPPNYPVSKICKAIDEAPKGATILDKIFGAFSQVTSFDTKRKCYGASQSDAQEIDESLGWSWQLCTEIVNLGDSTANNTMFELDPWSIESKNFKENCKIMFDVIPRIHWFDTYYGGKDIKLVLQNFGSNIIFYNGLKDPLSSMSVLENLSDTMLAINAKEGSHTVDLIGASSTDPEWLVMVRKKEADIIEDWITKYYFELSTYLHARN